MTLNWFFSRTVRQATAMRSHVEKLLAHQRDILAPQAVEGVQTAIDDLGKTVVEHGDKAALEKQMENIEKAANKWLKPYPNAAWRENVEVLLVALAVAMGIRTFFLQPFKIPTGSMQPTLYGVTSVNLLKDPNSKIPTGLTRVREWFEGTSYIHEVADNDGTFDRVDPAVGLKIFNIKQTFYVGGKPYTIWFPPDFGSPPGGTLEGRADLHPGDPEKVFHKGEDIIKLKISAGDHLFVDRLTYNFRPPERGEIVVFKTQGIPEEARQRYFIPGDQFYIKRLVGLGGETLSLKEDYELANVGNYPGVVPAGHLMIDGKPLSPATPHFENLYSFYGASRAAKVLDYKENHYYGHALIWFLEPGRDYHVEPDDYFVMGDNTMNSLDSRYWGGFPKSAVIGKSFFVYWPITSRFGWGQR
jgi:signal peptidase I